MGSRGGDATSRLRRGGKRKGDGVATSEQEKTLNRIANRTRNLKKEQHRLINEAGEVVYEKKGDKKSVGFRASEIRDIAFGAVDIHNHPEGTPFSAEDLQLFMFPIRAAVVSAPEGNYRLTNRNFGKKDKRGFLIRPDWQGLQEAFRNSPNTIDEFDFMKARKAAMETKRVSKLKKALDDFRAAEGEKALRSFKEGKGIPKSYTEKDERLLKQYKQALKEEIKNVQTRANHEFFKANAKKYGFDYSFERQTRSK